MLVLPGNMLLGALWGVLGRLLGSGELPCFIFLTAFWGLIKGENVRKKASDKFIKNVFRQFCGSTFAAQKADDTILHICKIDVQPKKEFF